MRGPTEPRHRDYSLGLELALLGGDPELSPRGHLSGGADVHGDATGLEQLGDGFAGPPAEGGQGFGLGGHDVHTRCPP